ncbi:cell division protein FtsB [Ramlibacter sp. H39-3-26]|uniref:cell division protein FtsB n=1 Tax=Curvibacter soli TaxID=3031331 RepID=UPI0023DA95B3|nr:cell division protein FtsB [Ramlibacter sp. H39-3-26]MDF1486515.1 cell division protein FtsB [Ramlibacter sp. H39-3-26]
MGSRLIPVVLLILLVAVHTQLWFGRGGLPEVAQMRHQLARQKAANAQAQQANERLASEVSDLKEGLDTVEEKARSELGMVKQGEIYVQVAP